MIEPWPADGPGVLELADGRRVRGRGVRAGLPEGLDPTFGLYLLGRPAPPTPWEARWVRWPDFRLPRDPDDAVAALREAFDRAAHERVEVACGGGTGRTGTALACLAVLAGTPPDEAVAFVRSGYRSRAVETRAQRRFVATFTG
ncbi:MAG TPA: protein-tyrosine phosphatase family protein [Iamia sp.]